MDRYASPREIVDRQLLAYNARDIEAYCALFAADAVIFRLRESQEIVRGIDAIRAYYTARFRNPHLHCTIKSRMELGDFIVDHEGVSGLGDGALEVIALYEVRNALIQTVRLIWP